MKKLTMVLVILCLVAAGAFAITPEYFSFNVGAMGTYAVASGDIGASNPFGIQFQFDDTFAAGFNFDGGNISTLNITVTPMDNVNFTMNTGSIYGDLGFGAGIGYDFLVKKDALFTAMGLYLEWLGCNSTAATSADYNIADGGVLSIGLKAKFGL